MQNFAAKTVCNVHSRRAHAKPLLKRLHWLPCVDRATFKVALLVHKALLGSAPSYLSELLIRPSRASRSSSSRKLIMPTTRFKSSNCAFEFAAPSVWNSLPISLTMAESTEVFKKELKTLLFRGAFRDVED